MNKEALIILAGKVSDGTASDQELEQYNLFFNQFRYDDDIEKEIVPGLSAEQDLLKRINRGLVCPNRANNRRLYIGYSVAAAVLLFISGTIFFYSRTDKNNRAQPAVVAGSKKELIKSGGSRAMLTLADGSVIALDSAGNCTLASQGNMVVANSQPGVLTYASKSTDDNQFKDVTAFNILTTPKGGQYQVELSDGTRVWLNAASSLKYPASFSQDTREVELTGEAYFEVAKNRNKPFRVVSGNQQLEVLGTHFNINAYADEGLIRTTLVEGSVRLKQMNGMESVILHPGHQALLTEEKIKVEEADTGEATGWKDGYFMFSNENAATALRKIARWYDVSIEYRGDVSKKVLWGSVSRYKNISEVLDILELTGFIHFEIENRKVIVMPSR